MDFLAEELSGLPETYRKVVLKQLEASVKEIQRYFSDAMYNDLSHDLALHRSAAKIFGVLDSARKFKQQLENE